MSTVAEFKHIPDISPEEVSSMLKTIRPLVRQSTIRTLEDGGFEIEWDKPLYNIETPDPFQSFVWDPKFLDKVDENSLIRLTILRTYHTTGYHGLCKPSIAEVLAQIPLDMRPIVTAFEVVTDRESTEFVDKPELYGHRLVTILYRDRM